MDNVEHQNIIFIKGADEPVRFNYRIVEVPIEEGLTGYTIFEMYYDTNDNIVGWTDSSISPFGESPDELNEDINSMQAAFTQPVILLEDLIELAKSYSDTELMN